MDCFKDLLHYRNIHLLGTICLMFRNTHQHAGCNADSLFKRAVMCARYIWLCWFGV